MNTNAEFTNTFGNAGYKATEALPAERAAFIRRTYIHLALAILAFGLLEASLMMTGAAFQIAQTFLGGRWSWAIVLIGFMGVAWLAQSWANSQTSRPMQYMGLALYTVAEAIIFAPLLYIAVMATGDFDVIVKAGVVTLGLFLGLTAVVFMTRKDFSFLGPILAIGGFVALGFIFSGIIFGFSLGNIFAFAMVAFAGGAILYSTSNILHQYNTDQHVAASLQLFASVALLLWYLIAIFSGRE